MKSEVIILEEFGYNAALYGLGLSREITSNVTYHEFLSDINYYSRMVEVAEKLSKKDGGHNKFLESIQVWIDLKFPRYWWQQFDTYRVGMTKQSESTMYNIKKRDLIQEDFEGGINDQYLDYLNKLPDIESVKKDLPESFLQKRIINTNYKTLKNIINQRSTHKLKEWRLFVEEVLRQLKHPNLIKE